MRFINGLSSRYSDSYPKELIGIMSERDFKDVVQKLNEILITFWPCYPCYLFGYIFAPCTVGLSFLCPWTCISQAEEMATKYLSHTSCKDKFYSRNITWGIKKYVFFSQLEIKFPVSLYNQNNGCNV